MRKTVEGGIRKVVVVNWYKRSREEKVPGGLEAAQVLLKGEKVVGGFRR